MVHEQHLLGGEAASPLAEPLDGHPHPWRGVARHLRPDELEELGVRARVRKGMSDEGER